MKFRFTLLGPDDDARGSDPRIDPVSASAFAGLGYQETTSGLVRREPGAGGTARSIPITNFTARITTDIVLDDGAEQERSFGIEARVGCQTVSVTIPASTFARMNWVLEKLGPQAIIYPGQQQHARAAIQALSTDIRQQRVYTHTGWRKHGDQWIYLHAGGAIAAGGTVADIRVRLPAQVACYSLRLPVDDAATVRAIQASLAMLDLAPDRITIPLLASVYRAVMGGVDFSVFLTGRTGAFKTALAALAQQHFGPTMGAGTLPGNFASTPNALELLTFHAKDALLVVDDYAPTGGHGDSELQSVAERLFRAAGNGQGRSRMDSRGQLQAHKPPRGLVLATGEDLPTGHSIRGRLLIMEMAPGDVNVGLLGDCQGAAGEELLAEACGAFIRWVSARYEEIHQRHRDRVAELRSQHRFGASHARTPGMVAELRAALDLFLEFATDARAITPDQRSEMDQRAERALTLVAVMQSKHQDDADPALRFLHLLGAAIASGRAHVADRAGQQPKQGERWGWHAGNGARSPVPNGARIGWLDGDDLFLDSSASYRVTQEMAGRERLPIGEQTLRQRLAERGVLVSVDQKRETLKVRRMIEGEQRQVLHLTAGDLWGEAMSGLSGRERA